MQHPPASWDAGGGWREGQKANALAGQTIEDISNNGTAGFTIKCA
jgi:hypothetical protein